MNSKVERGRSGRVSMAKRGQIFYRAFLGIPYVIGPKMELFCVPFERHYSDTTNVFERQYSK